MFRVSANTQFLSRYANPVPTPVCTCGYLNWEDFPYQWLPLNPRHESRGWIMARLPTDFFSVLGLFISF